VKTCRGLVALFTSCVATVGPLCCVADAFSLVEPDEPSLLACRRRTRRMEGNAIALDERQE